MYQNLGEVFGDLGTSQNWLDVKKIKDALPCKTCLWSNQLRVYVTQYVWSFVNLDVMACVLVEVLAYASKYFYVHLS